MQRKIKVVSSLLTLGFCAALALTAATSLAQDKKADVNGTWKFTGPPRGQNPGAEMTMKLKADGEKVTGTLTMPGFNGGDPIDSTISDGKLKGDALSFNVVREGRNGGNPTTNMYEGKVSGDTIKGTQPAGRGRRGGGGDTSATPPARPEWTATRSK
jgi:hypothetical protein